MRQETWLVKHREAKVCSLERRILIFVKEKEIFRLEISMNNTHGMTGMNNLHNGSQQGSSSSLCVMSLGDDPVKKLSSGT